MSVAISHNANLLGAAIRADLSEESDHQRAKPVLEVIDDVAMFTSPMALGYIPGVIASANALAEAEKHLLSVLLAFDYDGTAG